MAKLLHKVNSNEKILGWYSTGLELRQNDLTIHQLIAEYCPSAVLLTVNVISGREGLPAKAYGVIPETGNVGKITLVFKSIPICIRASEPEAVGVEHLLRDIKTVTEGSLTQRINTVVACLKIFKSKIDEIKG